MALAGQKYSMGIYLWHLFFMIFLDWAVPLLVSAIRPDMPRVATFVLVNVAAFVLALTFTRFVFKSHRYWVSV
jgi:peptidoglycan/LPS O-acetylase OafA/YrhL